MFSTSSMRAEAETLAGKLEKLRLGPCDGWLLLLLLPGGNRKWFREVLRGEDGEALGKWQRKIQRALRVAEATASPIE